MKVYCIFFTEADDNSTYFPLVTSMNFSPLNVDMEVIYTVLYIYLTLKICYIHAEKAVLLCVTCRYSKFNLYREPVHVY